MLPCVLVLCLYLLVCALEFSSLHYCHIQGVKRNGPDNYLGFPSLGINISHFHSTFHFLSLFLLVMYCFYVFMCFFFFFENQSYLFNGCFFLAHLLCIFVFFLVFLSPLSPRKLPISIYLSNGILCVSSLYRSRSAAFA